MTRAIMPDLFTATLFHLNPALDDQPKTYNAPPVAKRAKVYARSIGIDRAEGRTDECITATLAVTRERPAAEVDIFKQANRLLSKWAETAPKGGCYDKCDFTVTWDDGEIYQGRYDLKHESEEPADLAAHMLGILRFYAGEYCPAHMTPEDYRAFIDQTEKGEPGNRAEFRAYLETYQIGSEATQ